MSSFLKPDMGLLLLRLGLGLMMLIGHGWGKMLLIGTEKASQFPAFFGLPPEVNQFLAATAEGVGALFIAIGFMTRGSSIALTITMLVAAFMAHGADPFFPQTFFNVVSEFKVLMSPNKEFALLYGVGFLALSFTGAGRYSLDHKFSMKMPRFLKFFS